MKQGFLAEMALEKPVGEGAYWIREVNQSKSFLEGLVQRVLDQAEKLGSIMPVDGSLYQAEIDTRNYEVVFVKGKQGCPAVLVKNLCWLKTKA